MKRFILFAGLASLAACSLFTDLDGFTGGSKDGGGGSGLDAGLDDGSSANDSGGTDGSNDVDGGPDASEGEPLLVVGGGRSQTPNIFEGDTIDNTFYAPLKSDGTLGEWKAGPTLPFKETAETRVVASSGRVYFFSYYTAVSTKKTAAGGLEALTLETAPEFRGSYCTASAGGAIFRFGGHDGTALNNVDGTSTPTLGWTATSALPDARYFLGCAGSEKFVYVVGGKNSAGVHQSTVFMAPKAAGGLLGPWAETTPVVKTSYWPRPVVVGSYLVVVGADWDDADLSTVLVGKLDEAGKVVSWQIGTPTKYRLSVPSVAVWKNRIVVTGGFEVREPQGEVTTRTITATVDQATGTVSPWTDLTPLPMPMVLHGSAFASP